MSTVTVQEIAIVIDDRSIPIIMAAFDPMIEALEVKKGWYFIGEVGCDYWYAILSPETFKKRYRTQGRLFDNTRFNHVVKKEAPYVS